MNKQAFISITLCLLSCLQGRGAVESVFAVSAKSDLLTVQFQWDAAQALTGACPEFSNPVTTVLNPGDTHPSLVRVMPIDDVWSAAQIESISASFQNAQGEEVAAVAGHVLDLNVAHMGRRAFLRIEVRPFDGVSESGESVVLSQLKAQVRLSTAKSVERLSRLADSAPAGVLSAEERLSIPLGLSGAASFTGDFAVRKGFTNEVAWKICVGDYGLYSLSGAELAAAGVPEAVRNSEALRLTCRDQEVPFWASTTGLLQSNEVIRFFGAALDSPYSTQNVYWLTAEAPGAGSSTRTADAYASGSSQTTAWTKVVYDHPSFFKAAYQPLDESFNHWFSMEIYGGTSSNVSLGTPHPVATGVVEMAYSLRGVNEYAGALPDHRSLVYANGHLVVTRGFDGEKHVYGTTNFPISYLNTGTTTFQFTQEIPTGVPAADFSTAYLEDFSLTYERKLKGDRLPLYFQGRVATGNVQVADCSDASGWVLDLTDPLQPVMLTNFTWSGSVLTFSDRVGSERFFGVFGTSDVQQVQSLECVRFRDLADVQREADYLLIAPEHFHTAAYRLLKHRFKNERRVQVASPEEIYNTFSYGIVDPLGLQQYIGYAWYQYAHGPETVLLVGNGSYDPLQFTGHAELSDIPVIMGSASFRWTSLPQWYACINGGDWLPDVALGILPVSSASDFEEAVDKMISFAVASTNAAWRSNALLVADNADGQEDFKTFCVTNTAVHLEQAGFDSLFGIQTAYLDDIAASQVRQTINGFLNAGGQVLHYMGHGSVSQWAAENIWSVTDVTNAVNTVFPIFTVFTCQSGAFHEPEGTCLAQAVLSESGAGSGCVAPTALSIQTYAEELADGFYGALADGAATSLGEAMQAAFLNLWTRNPYARELRFYTVFGDPALPVGGGAKP